MRVIAPRPCLHTSVVVDGFLGTEDGPSSTLGGGPEIAKRFNLLKC